MEHGDVTEEPPVVGHVGHEGPEGRVVCLPRDQEDRLFELPEHHEDRVQNEDVWSYDDAVEPVEPVVGQPVVQGDAPVERREPRPLPREGEGGGEERGAEKGRVDLRPSRLQHRCPPVVSQTLH